ncbi:MAG: type II toxin-antitoxin system VapC family toxin [Deltaproteobacteria bacterium]|nr:type II toxin-antitoxin system VapC family toxin [Deltaproteobacteria bacterium]
MKEAIIVDTGYWIALLDRRDTNHIVAKRNSKTILQKYRLYLTDFIVFETITYLKCSIGRHDLALRFLKKVKDSSLTMVPVDEGVKKEALELFKKYSDKTLSVTDCASFVIMKEKEIRKYAGFDDHFKQMGYACVLK